METLSVIKKSNSGSTKVIDTIYFVIDKPNTYASSILLKAFYWEHDEDNFKSIANKMRQIKFSRDYLTNVKETTGNLSCSYCPKTNLIIELEGMKVPNKSKATIDHIIATSKGGARYDYDNVCVCCGSCNTRKSDKSVEEFLKNRKIN